MYEVSAEYLTAIKQPAIQSRVVGTIAGMPFTDDNIPEGSFSITNQNSGNEKVQIGTVYIGELSITLRGMTFNRYTMDGMEIVPNFELLLADGVTWESVPLGKYYVGEANHTAVGVVIKAYDRMANFDKKYNGQQMIGKAYELAVIACEQCGVPFGMTEAEVQALPNGDEVLSVYSENDIETWRDYLSWLAQALGCFATIDRSGQLVFRQYAQVVVDTVDPTGRFKGSSYSDYETRYTGLYCTNIETSTMDYYALEQDDGLTYSLGENPFLQYGTDESKNALRLAVLDGLSLIRYIPFSATLPENPAYDLGDVLSLPGGLGDADKLFCVNKYTWTYHRGIKLEGVGQNPALASARSKSDKNIAGLETKVNTKDIIVHSFTNASGITLTSDKEREIISINYAATADTRIIFLATIPFMVDRDGYLVIRYYIDGVLQENDTLRQYVERGEHFVTISTSRAIERNARATMSVRALTEFFESDNRQQSAKIASILDYIDTGTYTEQTVDTTAPKMAIAKRAIKAVLYAQGLAGTTKWDGTITIDESFDKFGFDDIQIVPFNGVVSVESKVPQANIFAEAIAPITFDVIQIKGFRESLGVNEIVVNYTFETGKKNVYEYNSKYVKADDKFMLNTEYVYQGVEQTIDSGKMCAVSIDTSQFSGVDSIGLGVV